MASSENISISWHAKQRFIERIDTRLRYKDTDHILRDLYEKSSPIPINKLGGKVQRPDYLMRLARYNIIEDVRRVVLVVRAGIIVTLYPVIVRHGEICPDKRQPLH